MRRLYRNNTFSELTNEDAVARLREISNDKCFLSDIILNIFDETVFFENNIKKYSNGFLLKKDAANYLNGNPFNKSEIVDPFIDNPKLHLYLRTEATGIALVGITEKGRNTVSLINSYVGKPNEFVLKIQDIYSKILAELQEIKEDNIENANSKDDFKLGINRLWRMLTVAKKSDLTAVRMTALLYHEDYSEIKEIIETTEYLKKNERSEILKKIFALEYQMYKDAKLSTKKNEIKNKIKNAIKKLNYREALELATHEELSSKITSWLNYAQRLANNEDNSDSLYIGDYFSLLKNDVLKARPKFLSLNSNETKYGKLIRHLSVGQKHLELNNRQKFISSICYFFEYYCFHFATRMRGGGMKSKLREAKRNANANIDDLISTFDHAVNANSTNPNWIALDKERNLIAHEGKSISENSFNIGFEYLYKSVPGFEDSSNLVHKWFEIFELPEVNIFDQLNNKILDILSNPDNWNQD